MYINSFLFEYANNESGGILKDVAKNMKFPFGGDSSHLFIFSQQWIDHSSRLL